MEPNARTGTRAVTALHEWAAWQPPTRYDTVRRPGPSGFGLLLWEARAAAGLSQQQLAKLAAYEHTYISRLELGGRTPTRTAANRLADALGMTGPNRDRFLAAAGYLPGDVVSLIDDEPECRDLLRRLAHPDTPERQRHAIRAAVRALLDATEAMA